jgi:hypothetical protein
MQQILTEIGLNPEYLAQFNSNPFTNMIFGLYVNYYP